MQLRRIDEIGVKWQIRDEQASIEYAQNEGYRQGEAKGKAIGRAVNIELISKVTGLSIDEIEKLK